MESLARRHKSTEKNRKNFTTNLLAAKLPAHEQKKEFNIGNYFNVARTLPPIVQAYGEEFFQNIKLYPFFL